MSQFKSYDEVLAVYQLGLQTFKNRSESVQKMYDEEDDCEHWVYFIRNDEDTERAGELMTQKFALFLFLVFLTLLSRFFAEVICFETLKK